MPYSSTSASSLPYPYPLDITTRFRRLLLRRIELTTHKRIKAATTPAPTPIFVGRGHLLITLTALALAVEVGALDGFVSAGESELFPVAVALWFPAPPAVGVGVAKPT